MSRFIYDYMIEFLTATFYSLKNVGGVKLELSLYERMAPWLEREVLGHSDGDILPPPKRREPGFYWDSPEWHDLNQNLEKSNYTSAV